ncbi:DNA-protecting protein DprA [Herminiimonas sp. KBW02]|uniref:DNA-processing protein DprA n=1 Tax=Herminiimonas sp. KBW02 TaxID=2153363 RepID=UPI000F5B52D1|nr:DNA-processing protein DprA [Herminiimonas sp. KBW02]RQO37353.1 DNA-protecting protein DprA [Herminiimonas sp. KBW02]
MPAPDDLADWLRLEQTPGVGADSARKLLSVFGLPHNIFNSSLSALQEITGSRIAQALLAPPSDTLIAQIARTQEWAAHSENHVCTLGDADYPQALLEIHDPPILLYAKGRIDLLNQPSVAIVGSRNASAQGISNAELFATALSTSGLTIISGLALGIDTAAHQGALEALSNQPQAGSTIAVIGTGADIVYPARNRALAHQIAEHGCILSEYPLGMPAIASNFPRRNRIISGLARGVLVVEAALQSGSLITARMAAEQGRDMFAIPGSIHSPLAKGCHLLIKQGAKLVESAQDILEELEYASTTTLQPAATAPADDAPYAHVLQHMGYDAVDADTLAQRCQLDMAELHAHLLALELDGHAEMLAGGLYRRVDRRIA